MWRVVFPIRFSLIANFQSVRQSRVPSIPASSKIRQRYLVSAIQGLSQRHPPSTFLQVRIPRQFIHTICPRPSIPSKGHITQRSSAPFSMMFRSVRLSLIPTIKVQRIRSRRITPLYFPGSQYTICLNLFRPRHHIRIRRPYTRHQFPSHRRVPFSRFQLRQITKSTRKNRRRSLERRPGNSRGRRDRG